MHRPRSNHYQKQRTLALSLTLLAAFCLPAFLPQGAGRAGSSSEAQTTLTSSDPVIAAAGDIACDPTDPNYKGGSGTSTGCRQQYTSDLLVNEGLAAVLDLGDNQYFCGGYSAFQQVYDPTWGRVKPITHPAVGNHEYLTSGGTGCTTDNEGATGYFQYFGSAAGPVGKGYYSFDMGSWHLIAVNSSCNGIGGCGTGSPEYEWLKSDLEAHKNLCTLAYWHIPLFSSGGRASSSTRPLWQLLYDNDADLVLNGHDHIYERFAPQTPSGQLDLTRGIREFIVGTGGANHTSIVSVAANSLVRNTDTFGVLELTLHPTGYDWKFVREAVGSFSDSGSASCHGSDTVPPTAPTDLRVTNVTSTSVSLQWAASKDNVGVSGYRVFRNATQIADVKTLSYTDHGLTPQTSYSYFVVAYDRARLVSARSNLVMVATMPAPTPTPMPSPTPSPPAILFKDGFESGSLQKWSVVRGMTVEKQIVSAGTYSASALSSSGTPAYVRKALTVGESDVSYRIHFNILSQGSNALRLLEFRTTRGAPILVVRVNAAGKLGYADAITHKSYNSRVNVVHGVWQTLVVRIGIHGADSRVDVWYNNKLLPALSRPQMLGTDLVRSVQLGEDRIGPTYSVVFDSVVVVRPSTGHLAPLATPTP